MAAASQQAARAAAALDAEEAGAAPGGGAAVRGMAARGAYAPLQGGGGGSEQPPRLGRRGALAALALSATALVGAAAWYSRTPRASAARGVAAGRFDWTEFNELAAKVAHHRAAEHRGGTPRTYGVASSAPLIERDLVDVVFGRVMPHGLDHVQDRALRPPADIKQCRAQADLLFTHAMEKSGLQKELTADESSAFGRRFSDAMHEGCEGSATFDAKAWLKRAMKEMERQKPVFTQALAEHVNAQQLGFQTEMRPWMLEKSKVAFEASLGRRARPHGMKDVVHHEHGMHTKDHEQLPEEFNAAQKWPTCDRAILRVMNQGECGSCWAFSAAAVLDARICIAGHGTFNEDADTLSRGHITSCATKFNGCNGGWEYYAFEYMDRTESGIPTTNCVPYFGTGEGIDHFQAHDVAPKCDQQCRGGYPRTVSQDRFKAPGVSQYQLLLDPFHTSGKLEQCKRAIFEEGPIAFGIYASYRFMGYKSGVYRGNCGLEGANHAVYIFGWGGDHLMAKNSWGENWGAGGKFNTSWCEMTDCTIPGPIDKGHLELAMPIPKLVPAAA